MVIKRLEWLLPRFTNVFALLGHVKRLHIFNFLFMGISKLFALSEINRGTKSCCIYTNQILILSPYHIIQTSLSASLAKKTNVFTVFGLLTCTIQNTAHATMSIWSKKDLAVLCCLSLHTVLKVIARRVHSLKGFDLLKWWALKWGKVSYRNISGNTIDEVCLVFQCRQFL